MMFRQLGFLWLTLASLAGHRAGAEPTQGPLVGMELVATAHHDMPDTVDSMTSVSLIDRFFATYDRYARAFDLDLNGGRIHKLPIHAPCRERKCDRNQRYRCVLHQHFYSFHAGVNHTLHDEEPYWNDESEPQFRRHLDDPIFGQFAAGCTSEGQQWVSILNHQLNEEICHTESTPSGHQIKMVTASDSYYGHFFFSKPSTREVCVIANYAECSRNRLCPPPRCHRFHSDIVSMAAFGAFGYPNPNVAVGLASGSVVFLEDMQVVNSYDPPCSCVDCVPIPISIAASPLAQRMFILYRRCERGNFVNAIQYLFGDARGSTVIPIRTLASVRSPSILHIALAPQTEVLYMTSYRGGNKYYLIATMLHLAPPAPGSDALAPVPLSGEFRVITYATLPGRPTAMQVDRSDNVFVATDRDRVCTPNGVRRVEASFYATVRMCGAEIDVKWVSSHHLISKFVLRPVVPLQEPLVSF